MNLAGPFFALLAAGAWGATDFVGGVTSRAAGVLVTLLMVQVYGTLLSLALLPFAGEAIPEPAALVWAAASGASGLVGVGCLFLALSRGTMGLVAPLAALVAVSVPAVVGVVSGDRIGLLLAAGLVVATVAIVVISLPDRRLGTPALATFHGSRAREWLLILVSGLGSAGFFLAVDHAHDAGAGTVWTLVSVRITSLAVVSGAIAFVSVRRRRSMRRVPRIAVSLGLLTALGDTGGSFCYIVANALGTLSSTVVLASLAPVGTVLLARAMLHERLSPLRLVGVGLAVTGAALISLGALSA